MTGRRYAASGNKRLRVLLGLGVRVRTICSCKVWEPEGRDESGSIESIPGSGEMKRSTTSM